MSTRTHQRPGGCALALAALLALSGCVPADPEPTPTPTSSDAPLFASEEEALAAATEAYAAFQATLDSVLMDGGARPERIDDVATGSARDQALESFTNFRDNSYRTIGATKVGGIKMQATDNGSEVVSIYVCLNIENVDVVDGDGVSVVLPSRPNEQAFEVGFVEAGLESGQIVVDRRDVWAGSDVCT